MSLFGIPHFRMRSGNSWYNKILISPCSFWFFRIYKGVSASFSGRHFNSLFLQENLSVQIVFSCLTWMGTRKMYTQDEQESINISILAKQNNCVFRDDDRRPRKNTGRKLLQNIVQNVLWAFIRDTICLNKSIRVDGSIRYFARILRIFLSLNSFHF